MSFILTLSRKASLTDADYDPSNSPFAHTVLSRTDSGTPGAMAAIVVIVVTVAVTVVIIIARGGIWLRTICTHACRTKAYRACLEARHAGAARVLPLRRNTQSRTKIYHKGSRSCMEVSDKSHGEGASRKHTVYTVFWLASPPRCEARWNACFPSARRLEQELVVGT